MSNWGGRREGAGRPRGTQNANTKARREAVKAVVAQFEVDHPDAFPGDAVAFMQCVYRDQSLPLDVRLDAASKCARFERPALMAAAVASAPALPSTPGAVEERISELLRKGLANRVRIIDAIVSE